LGHCLGFVRGVSKVQKRIEETEPDTIRRENKSVNVIRGGRVGSHNTLNQVNPKGAEMTRAQKFRSTTSGKGPTLLGG